MTQPTHLPVMIAKLFHIDAASARNVCTDMTVRTQLDAQGHGIFDISLSSQAGCLLVESKVGASEGYRQLDRYAEYLALKRSGVRAILYLTHPFQPPRERPPACARNIGFRHLRWSDVLRIIRDVSRGGYDPVLDFLLTEFESLLCHWGLVMSTRVSHTLMEGVRAIPPLAHMIKEALGKCEAVRAVSKSKSHDYIGWNLKMKGGAANDFWIGIYFDRPERLWAIVKPAVAERIRKVSGKGILVEAGCPWEPATPLPALDFEGSGFFSCKDPDGQAVVLGGFINLLAQAANPS